jgi:hypothetical protein
MLRLLLVMTIPFCGLVCPDVPDALRLAPDHPASTLRLWHKGIGAVGARVPLGRVCTSGDPM